MEVGFVVFMSCSIMQRDGHKKKHFLKIGVTMRELRQYVVQVRLWWWADNGGWMVVVVVLGSPIQVWSEGWYDLDVWIGPLA